MKRFPSSMRIRAVAIAAGLFLYAGAGRTQSISLTGVPELQRFYDALPRLNAGLENLDTNQVEDALLDLVPLNAELTRALETAIARVQAAGLTTALPQGATDELLELSQHQVQSGLSRFDALRAASVYLTTLDTNFVVIAQSNLVNAVDSDTELAAALAPPLLRIASVSIPADLLLTVENDPEYRPGNIAGVRVEVRNVGDESAEDVRLTFKRTSEEESVSTAEVALGTLAGLDTEVHLFLADIPANRDSMGILVQAVAQNTDPVFAYEVILVNTNAP